MASVTDICNQALREIGQTSILTILEDSKKGRACQAGWPIARDAALRSHPWNCATERASLGALGAAPAWGWEYQYQWPADALRILEVYTVQTVNTEWVVEGRRILTDLSAPLDIRYIKRVENTGLYDALLVVVCIARMALQLCEEFTQSNTKKQEIRDWFEKAKMDARGVDAQESAPGTFQEDSWITARE